MSALVHGAGRPVIHRVSDPRGDRIDGVARHSSRPLTFSPLFPPPRSLFPGPETRFTAIHASGPALVRTEPVNAPVAAADRKSASVSVRSRRLLYLYAAMGADAQHHQAARSLIQIKSRGEIGKIELPSVRHALFRPARGCRPATGDWRCPCNSTVPSRTWKYGAQPATAILS
jgi:hypothetical protein